MKKGILGGVIMIVIALVWFLAGWLLTEFLLSAGASCYRYSCNV